MALGHAHGRDNMGTRLEALYGLEPGAFAGTYEAYVSQLHPDEVAMVLDTVQQAVKDKARYTTEHRVVWPDGTVRWLQGKGQVTLSDSGEVTGTMGCVADITERAEAALAREHSLAWHDAAKRNRSAPSGLRFWGGSMTRRGVAETRQ